MALNPAGLQSDLEAFFAAGATTETAAANAWADAVRSYTTAIVPAVASPVQEAAKLTMVAALTGFSASGAAPALFSAAFVAYAATLSSSMVGAPPAVPPPLALSVTLNPILAVTYPTHAAAASAIATVIDAWFRTGLSPSGAGAWS